MNPVCIYYNEYFPNKQITLYVYAYKYITHSTVQCTALTNKRESRKIQLLLPTTILLSLFPKNMVEGGSVRLITLIN